MEKYLWQFQCANSCQNYQEAIELAAKPLLDNGYITRDYIQAMINSVIEFGAYIVLAPNFAMPHALPGDYVLKDGFALLKLEQPVEFEVNNPDSKALIIMPIACKSANGHMEMISQIANLFMDENLMNRLLNARSPKELYGIFQSIERGECDGNN